MLTTLELAYNAIGDRGALNPNPNPDPNPDPNPNPNPDPNPNPNPNSNPNPNPNQGDRGAEGLAFALGQNRTLTYLDIAGNGIGVAGAQALLDIIITLTPALTPNSSPNPTPPI